MRGDTELTRAEIRLHHGSSIMTGQKLNSILKSGIKFLSTRNVPPINVFRKGKYVYTKLLVFKMMLNV